MIPHHTELRRSLVYDRFGEPIVERVQVPNPPDIPIEARRCTRMLLELITS
jgi:hypothetical protein